MVVIGLDLGVRFPARATLQLGGRKPVLVGSCRGNFAKLPKKERPCYAFNWLHAELRIAWVSDIRTVAIEDPRRAIVGLQRAGQTNYPAQSALIEQFHRVCERARAMGFTVITVEPREVVSRLGLKLTRGADPKKRRKEKKDQTRRWCELMVTGGTGLSEDEADAVSVAFCGASKLRAVRSET